MERRPPRSRVPREKQVGHSSSRLNQSIQKQQSNNTFKARSSWKPKSARMALYSNLPLSAATRCCQPPHPMRFASGVSNPSCKTAARFHFKSESESLPCCLDSRRPCSRRPWCRVGTTDVGACTGEKNRDSGALQAMDARRTTRICSLMRVLRSFAQERQPQRDWSP